MVWCVIMIFGMRLAEYAVLPVTAMDPDHLLNMDRPWRERMNRAKWLLAVWFVLELLILISFGVFVSLSLLKWPSGGCIGCYSLHERLIEELRVNF